MGLFGIDIHDPDVAAQLETLHKIGLDWIAAGNDALKERLDDVLPRIDKLQASLDRLVKVIESVTVSINVGTNS